MVEHLALQLKELLFCNLLIADLGFVLMRIISKLRVWLLSLMKNQMRPSAKERDTEDFQRRALRFSHCFTGAVDFGIVLTQFFLLSFWGLNTC